VRLTTGKCSACRVRYEWPQGRSRLRRNAYCPDCGDKLRATTHLLQWRVRCELPWFGSHVARDEARKRGNVFPKSKEAT
jgi:hypothetical protein